MLQALKKKIMPEPINLLSLFEGRCGHRWVGATEGSFGCPVCGDHDGDHHLVRMEEIPVHRQDAHPRLAFSWLREYRLRPAPAAARAPNNCSASTGVSDTPVKDPNQLNRPVHLMRPTQPTTICVPGKGFKTQVSVAGRCEHSL
jgi:hypothetical protein